QSRWYATGSPATTWPASQSWTKGSNGTYTARVYVDSNYTAIESNHNNNQATVVYYVGSGPTCPSASVGLLSSTINSGGTTQASAPAGWSGGTFQSSKTSVATVGST